MPRKKRQHDVEDEPVETTSTPDQCPFCGAGKPIYSDDPPAPTVYQFGTVFMVKCLNLGCGAFGPSRSTAEGAVKAWDTRRGIQAAYSQNLVRLFSEALYTDGGHHKQWYIEQIASALGMDLDQIDTDMARCGNPERLQGVAP